MTKLDKLRIAANHNWGKATSDANDEWTFSRAHEYLNFLDEVEGAGMQRPVDFGASAAKLQVWANDVTKDEEL